MLISCHDVILGCWTCVNAKSTNLTCDLTSSVPKYASSAEHSIMGSRWHHTEHTCAHTCAHTHAHAHMHACTHITQHAHTYTHAYTQHAHTHIYMHTHTYTHTSNTHTHIGHALLLKLSFCVHLSVFMQVEIGRWEEMKCSLINVSSINIILTHIL